MVRVQQLSELEEVFSIFHPVGITVLSWISFLESCHTLFLQLIDVRETGALEEAKDNVEKQVEALAWHLQLIGFGMFKVLNVKCYY
ncbi:hypothetical protein MKX03_010759 [Papaver bracteatum]|nr:hypothetical protein MKX03_010759 [Papaver bracteatum]